MDPCSCGSCESQRWRHSRMTIQDWKRTQAGPTGAQPPHAGTVSAFGRMPMRNRVRGVARLCGRRPRGHVGIGAGYKSCTRHRGGRKRPQKKKICLCPPLRRTGPAPAAGNTEGLAPETPAAGRREPGRRMMGAGNLAAWAGRKLASGSEAAAWPERTGKRKVRRIGSWRARRSGASPTSPFRPSTGRHMLLNQERHHAQPVRYTP